jgi:hypothetical protein
MELLLKQYENHSKNQLLAVASDLIIGKEKLELKASQLESEVSYLKFQLDQLKRMIFGSKSERFIAANTPENFKSRLILMPKRLSKL